MKELKLILIVLFAGTILGVAHSTDNSVIEATDSAASSVAGLFVWCGTLPKFLKNIDFDALLAGDSSEILKALKIYAGIMTFVALIVVVNVVLYLGCCVWCCFRCCCAGGCCRKNKKISRKKLDMPSANCMICCQVTTLIFVILLIVAMGFTIFYSLHIKDMIFKVEDNVFSTTNSEIHSLSTALGGISTNLTRETGPMANELFTDVSQLITNQSNSVEGAAEKKKHIKNVVKYFGDLESETKNTKTLSETMTTTAKGIQQINHPNAVETVNVKDIEELTEQQKPLANYENDVEKAKHSIEKLNKTANDMGNYVEKEFGTIKSDLKKQLDDSAMNVKSTVVDLQSSLTSLKTTVSHYRDMATDNKTAITWTFNGLAIIGAIYILAALLIATACIISFLSPHNQSKSRTAVACHKGLAAKFFVVGIVLLFAFTIFYVTIFPLVALPLGWVQSEICAPVKAADNSKLDDIVMAATNNSYLVDNYLQSLKDMGDTKIMSLLWKECPAGVQLADAQSIDKESIKEMKFFSDLKKEASKQIASDSVMKSIDETVVDARKNKESLNNNINKLNDANSKMHKALNKAKESLSKIEFAIVNLIKKLNNDEIQKLTKKIIKYITSTRNNIRTLKEHTKVIKRIKSALKNLNNNLAATLDGNGGKTFEDYLKDVVNSTADTFSANMLDNLLNVVRGRVSCQDVGTASKALAKVTCKNGVTTNFGFFFYCVTGGCFCFFLLWCLSFYLISTMTIMKGRDTNTHKITAELQAKFATDLAKVFTIKPYSK